jgi:hypothetical protein
MLTSRLNQHLLYLAWKLSPTDSASVENTKDRLVEGEGQHLYQLRAWAIANGQARALLVPEAPLEQIAEAIWATGTQPMLTRWVVSCRACSAVTREIEANRRQEMAHSAVIAA